MSESQVLKDVILVDVDEFDNRVNYYHSKGSTYKEAYFKTEKDYVAMREKVFGKSDTKFSTFKSYSNSRSLRIKNTLGRN